MGYSKWSYLGLEVEDFIAAFNAGHTVRLGMVHTNGDLNVATFTRAQVRKEKWENDREPRRDEVRYFPPIPPRQGLPEQQGPVPDRHAPPDSRTASQITSAFEEQMRKRWSGSGNRPQIVWFKLSQIQDRLRAGKSLKAGVYLHGEKSVDIYKIEATTYELSHQARQRDDDYVYVLRKLGYIK